MIKIFIYSLITLFLVSCKQPIQKNILKEDYNLLMINDSSYIEIYINSKSHVSLITKNVIHNKDTHSTDYIYENKYRNNRLKKVTNYFNILDSESSPPKYVAVKDLLEVKSPLISINISFLICSITLEDMAFCFSSPSSFIFTTSSFTNKI